MKRSSPYALAALLTSLTFGGDADGRGFGGFRGGGGFGGDRGGGFSGGGFSGYRGGGFEGGGFREGGYGGGGFGGYRSDSFGGFSGENRSFDDSPSRSGGYYSGARAGWGGSSYDRSWSGSRGGSVDASGERDYAYGPRGGAAAGSTRDVTATGPNGRSYSSSDARGAAVGPYGRAVGGGTRSTTASGPRGTASASSSAAFAGSRMSTDFGLSHYSSFSAAGVGHSTAYWSHGSMATHAGYVRTNFGYYGAFRPGWYTSHPGAWYAAGWAAGAAWTACTWPTVAAWCAIPAEPVYYDYGNTVVYQDNSVYVNGQDAGTAPEYATQATTIAAKGQSASVSPEQEWQSLGVFALVQGQEKTSNNVFQIAVNKDGILRGNYYNGLMDETTPIYGSVDKKTQRAAWTIGKKKDRVFETGIDNLTKDETPVLVHIGTDRTQQWLLVRVQQPQSANQ